MSHRLFSRTTLIATLFCLSNLLLPAYVQAADPDGDGIDDASDNCPLVYNPDQKNWDGVNDGGDACDADDDNDTYPDDTDVFPHDVTEWLDNDKDTIGDNKDPDDDNDGINDFADQTTPLPDNCQFIPNKNQLDSDLDTKGNECDDDDDGDGVLDINDAFPLDKTKSLDRDKDGIDDPHDFDNDNDRLEDANDPDDDNDTVPDVTDNCPLDANPDQKNSDGVNDGGDACDLDDDNDGHPDTEDVLPTTPGQWLDRDGDGFGDNPAAPQADRFPDNPAEWSDNDSDGDNTNSDLNDDYGDNRDPDDDNDGIPDLVEIRYGLNPKIADSNTAPIADADSDGFSNLAEYRAGSSPKDNNDTPATRKPAQLKLIAALGAPGDAMGGSVASAGGTTIIGSPNGHYNGRENSSILGAVHIIKDDVTHVITPSNHSKYHTGNPDDRKALNRFGKAVAVANNGSTVLISADGKENAGAVYLYNYDAVNKSWSEGVIFVPTANTPSQGFGSTLAVSGDTALISAPGTLPSSGSGSFAGAVFVYTRNPADGVWSYQTVLRGDDTAAQHFFGSSIALEGARAVIGASGVSNKGANTGKVYVFERSGSVWNPATSFQSNDATGGHYFGSSVALKGDTLVAGAIGVSDSGSNSGAAYIFKLINGIWTQQTNILKTTGNTQIAQDKLTAPDATAQLFFGYTALMTDSNTLMIGTPSASSRTTSNSGAVYIYRFKDGSWRYNGKLQSHDRRSGDAFGHSLAYSGATLLVGAPGVDDDGDGAGAGYNVDLTGIEADSETDVPNITGDTIADIFDNCPAVSNSDQADLDGDGKGDACDDDRDGDGVLNGADLYPGDPNESKNTDGDAMGDNIDPDADNDGIPDRIEDVTERYDANHTLIGKLNSLDKNDATADLDGDGYSNLAEYLAGTAINDRDDTPGKLPASYTRLISNDGTLNDSFGSSVALSGNYAIIGAVNGKSGGISSGAAYIFERNSTSGAWKQAAKLVASDAANLAKFGSSVAIRGDIVVVGAPGAAVSATVDNIVNTYSNAGAVYLFKRDGTTGVWSQTARLTATEPGTNHAFGSSVTLGSATRLAVGGPGAHKNGFVANSGAVYLFESSNSSWTQTKLTGFDSKGGDGFGASVALAGDLLMAGSPRTDTSHYATGAVYLYRRDSGGSWSEKRKLEAGNGLNGDAFGSSLSLITLSRTVGNTLTYYGALAIGAPGRDGKGAGSGAAYLFDYSSTTGFSDDSAWRQESLFEARDGARADALGGSVALTFTVDGTGKRNAAVLSGAQYRDGQYIDNGAAYLFTLAPDNLWVQQSPLVANNGNSLAYSYFGSSVALDDNNRLLIGASGIDDNDIDAGVAFVVDYIKADQDADGVYDSFDNCKETKNPDQLNTDGDSQGNACDPDDDNDGVNDLKNDGTVLDAFPLDPKEQLDTDHDGKGDKTDEDDDNDGIPDSVEDTLEDAQGNKILNSKDKEDAALDYDGDSLSNLKEYQLNTRIDKKDTDGDTYDDDVEVYYSTDPLNASDKPDTIEARRPVKPVINTIVSPLPLTGLSFDSAPFEDTGANDPATGTLDFLIESEWQINTTETFEDSGRILRRHLRGATNASDENKVRKLTIADGILLAGEHYWIRTRHRDDTYWSEWSEPVEFTLTSEGGHDANADGVDDRYFVGTGFDANGDGTIDPDSSEFGIVRMRNAGDNSIIAIQRSSGTYFGQLTAIPYSAVPAILTADGKMPYGLFNFRIEGLESTDIRPANVTITFYLPSAPPAGGKWYKFDPTTNTLKEITDRIEMSDRRVSLTIADGSELDADGVVNDVVVDPSGLYITLTDAEKLANYRTGALPPLALLGLLLCWPLRRLARKL